MLYDRARLHDQLEQFNLAKAIYTESVCEFLLQCEGDILKDIQSLDALRLSPWLIKIIAGYMEATLNQHRVKGIALQELERTSGHCCRDHRFAHGDSEQLHNRRF